MDISQLKPNDYIFVNIFFSAENYPFKMKYLGKEILKTKFGLVECMKFIPFMETEEYSEIMRVYLYGLQMMKIEFQ